MKSGGKEGVVEAVLRDIKRCELYASPNTPQAHIVSKGETLKQVAKESLNAQEQYIDRNDKKKFNDEVKKEEAELRRINKLKSDILTPGQIIFFAVDCGAAGEKAAP